MKKIEVAGTAPSATMYQLDDGRVIRVHLKLITPKEQLATADNVEVETCAFEVDKKGNFMVDNDGVPIMYPAQRARIPLTNVRQNMDSMKPGWVKQIMPTDEVQRAAVLAPHKERKTQPKTGEPGDIVNVDGELYTWTEGLYESVRRARVAQVPAAMQAEPFNEAQVADLLP